MSILFMLTSWLKLRIPLGNRIYQIQHTIIILKREVPNFLPRSAQYNIHVSQKTVYREKSVNSGWNDNIHLHIEAATFEAVCATRRSADNERRFNTLERRGNYSATSNNMKLVHWPLMVGCYIWYSEEGTERAAAVPPRPVPFSLYQV